MSNKKIEPIVFVNNPISKVEEDVVGLETSVDTIIEALKDNANMIGVIADYGTGKSSVTEILSNQLVSEPFNYPAPIKINMWDCLQKRDIKYEEENGTEESLSNEIGDLTKSFLFQLANGKDRKLASYINKRLSNNYGLLSFSLSSRHAWLFFVLAVISYAIGQIPSINNIYVPSFIPGILKEIGKLIYDISPVFTGIAIILAAIGISFSSIAFSHWKTEKRNIYEVNDIFDAYEYIINCLRPKGNKRCHKRKQKAKDNNAENYYPKKQIIIVEDLDRIIDKSIIVGFLKELYRFQTSLENVKNEFAFIISIKPEVMLKENENKTFEFDDKNIYSKIFDVTVLLKPIHYDDYDSVLIQLLKSNPSKKKALEVLIKCDEITDSLPKSFNWIKKGTNLTIRDLKDRLNSAIEIYVSLLNKKHKGNSSAKFEACAAVSYFEYQYPGDYSNLILDEESLSNLIDESYKIQNTNPTYNLDNLIDGFKNTYGENFNEKFIEELCQAIDDGLFDKDFRMYFYTYPMYSHIKTTEEKYLCDVLQLQNHDIDEKRLDECVNTVYEHGDNNIVTETLNKISQFSVAVLLNDKLLELATTIDAQAVFYAIDKYVFDANKNKNRGLSIMQRVHKQNNNKEIINHIIDSLPYEENTEKIYYTRRILCESFKEDIIMLKEVFMAGYLITEEEISLVGNPNIYTQLIDVDILDANSYEYISDSLIKDKITNENAFKTALKAFNHYIALLPSEQICENLLCFMEMNAYINSPYFEVIEKELYNTLDAKLVAKYLNVLDNDKLTKSSLLYNIDCLGLYKTIDIRIIKLLIENEHYYTPLLYCAENDCLNIINFDNNVESITSELQELINSEKYSSFLVVRKHIVSQNLYSLYPEIFFGEFPIISKEEYINISNEYYGIDYIDTESINEENVLDVCNIINAKTLNSKGVEYLFYYLFNPQTNNTCIVDKELIGIIIDNMDFYKTIQINTLGEVEKDKIIKPIYKALDLSIPQNSLAFMRHTKCLFPQLEEVLQIDENYHDEYIQLLNELDQYTWTTINWITDNLRAGYALPNSICEVLYEKDDFFDYIPSKSLSNDRLIIDKTIDFSYYITTYTGVPEMFEIMSKDTWFLENLRDSKQYSELTIEQLRPLYKVEQIEPLFKYVFNNYDNAEKMYYLNHYTKFKTEEDSKKFQLMICKPANLELIGDQGMYYKIRESLWESNPTHKAQFTKLWNQRWKK